MLRTWNVPFLLVEEIILKFFVWILYISHPDKLLESKANKKVCITTLSPLGFTPRSSDRREREVSNLPDL
jgi:hypothetical protein